MQSLWHKFSSPARIAVSCRKPLFVLFIAFFASLGISSQALAQSPTPVPTVPATANANSQTDLAQLQAMMGSLDTMLTQLQQVSPPAAAPTAVPAAAPNTAALMAEMQDLNGKIGPLMARMQTALQGNATPAEIAAIRAELDTVNGRMNQLMAEMARARSGSTQAGAASMPGMPAASTSMPAMGANTGTSSDLQQVEQLLLQAQAMLQQIKGQSGAASMPATTAGAMPMATPTPP